MADRARPRLARRTAFETLCALAALSLAPGARGYHERTEPSDGTVCSFRPVNPAPLVPDTLAVNDARGVPVPLAAFRGSTVLLNLWATWCPPCVRELPALDRLAGRSAADTLRVLPVSLDADGIVQAEPFYARLAIAHLPLLADPHKRLARFFPVDVLPASFVISSQGRVTHFLRSYVDWDTPAADRFFAAEATASRRAAAGCSPT